MLDRPGHPASGFGSRSTGLSSELVHLDASVSIQLECSSFVTRFRPRREGTTITRVFRRKGRVLLFSITGESHPVSRPGLAVQITFRKDITQGSSLDQRPRPRQVVAETSHHRQPFCDHEYRPCSRLTGGRNRKRRKDRSSPPPSSPVLWLSRVVDVARPSLRPSVCLDLGY